MHVDAEIVTDLADALERQIEAQGEAAKRAIRGYKKTILHETASGGAHQTEKQREVEMAVNHYISLRRRLDELRVRIDARQLSTGVG